MQTRRRKSSILLEGVLNLGGADATTVSGAWGMLEPALALRSDTDS
jgi:hypothetical protein